MFVRTYYDNKLWRKCASFRITAEANCAFAFELKLWIEMRRIRKECRTKAVKKIQEGAGD